MQPQRVTDNEISPVLDRRTATRGPNGQQAARAVEGGLIGSTKPSNDDEVAEIPVARRTEVPAANEAPSLKHLVPANTAPSRPLSSTAWQYPVSISVSRLDACATRL